MKRDDASPPALPSPAPNATLAARPTGDLMATEIAEQPTVWRRLLTDGAPAIEQAARRIRAARPRFVLFVARGSSDHAALYGRYLVEIGLQIPAGMASPSTMTVYGARPDLRDVLVVAVSQSGGSPDLVESIQVGRDRGARTLAVTNNPDSPLAAAAEQHIDVLAGPEQSVAATKSYTAQLLALNLLFAAAQERQGNAARTTRLPDLAEELLSRGPAIRDLAQRYRFANRLITTGRGYSYATALEAALKLMETSYISAQAFSGADLLHGPLAMIDTQVPVLAVVPDGPGGASMRTVLTRVRDAGADLCCIGVADAVRNADTGIELPTGVDESLSPLLEAIPIQLLALQLARSRGNNPDAPRALQKVTKTR